MFERILRQKLSLNKMDWMGLMIFGMKKSDPDLSSIYTIIKFDAVTKAMLANLKEFTQTNFGSEDWRPTREYPLSNSLLQAARCFDDVKVGMVTKHINLITCNDNPVQDDNEERHKTRIIAKNFKDIHVKIQVVGFGQSFNYHHFYQELMMLAERYPDQDVKKIQLNDLEEGVLRKANVIANLDFKVSDKFKIKVSIQGFSVNRRYASKVWMSKETNEILDRVSFYKQPFDEEEANEDNEEEKDIFDQNIRSVQSFSGTSIVFTPKEVQETKKIIEQGLELLGFKPIDEKYINFHLTAPVFLGCCAIASKEEKEFFSSLVKICSDREIMGICIGAIRDFGLPGLYCIWPCDEFGGFYLYKIPYEGGHRHLGFENIFLLLILLFFFVVENVRDIHDIADKFKYDNGNLPFTDENLQLMTDILKKSRIKYDASLFENPSQGKLRNYIQAIATDEEYDDTLFLDTTRWFILFFYL